LKRSSAAVQCRQSSVLTFRPTVFDRHVLALDVAGFLQTIAERRYIRRPTTGRRAVEESDYWHRLLRACGERFDVMTISRYFPEFEREMPRYLSQL
jgi:hypothetical protein